MILYDGPVALKVVALLVIMTVGVVAYGANVAACVRELHSAGAEDMSRWNWTCGVTADAFSTGHGIWTCAALDDPGLPAAVK